MKQCYVLLILILCFTACKKSTDSINDPGPASDIQFESHYPGYPIGYSGPNLIQGLEFDLNHDSINDFLVIAMGPLGYGDTDESFTIVGLDSNMVMGLVKQQQTQPQNRLLVSNYPLEVLSSAWSNKFYFVLKNSFSPEITCQSGNSEYLGLYLKKNNQVYLGWILLDWDLSTKILKVRATGVHKTPGLNINTGQN